MDRERILILGAAGRDFHDFNVFFRDRMEYEVVGFTAAQIPEIACRLYPPELSGPLYPEGLPIWPEAELEVIIRELMIDRCLLAYSDISHQEVMNLASRVISAGSDFSLMGTRTMLESIRPVIAVCAVRTGAGKSQTTRYVMRRLRFVGVKAVVIRHPMPYGNLSEESLQRFSSFSDLDLARVTIEEREEYEGHIANGDLVFAGVDYQRVLKEAEKESQVVVWDGGNNDLPFLRPDLWITVADALRPGHELTYYPGQINFRRAQVIVINKSNSASSDAINAISNNARQMNPGATVVRAASEISVDRPEAISGKRVLVIEDGPSLTHGGLVSGAGIMAAELYGASQVVDPRPYAVGSIKEVFAKYHHIGDVLPAMGYYPEQIRDLERSVNQVDCDAVIVATPIDLRQIIKLEKPSARVTYELADMSPPLLSEEIDRFLSHMKKRGLI
jgi:predicted GTPase